MLFLGSKKIDPIIKLKMKEKNEKAIPVIILFKEPPSNRFKNSISKNRGKIKYEYGFMNALAGILTLDEIDRISDLPEVTSISYDRKANVCMDRASSCIGVTSGNPYSLTGKGIGIAVIDTGVYPHGDLLRPYKVITAFRDFINMYLEPYDDNGHGTFIAGTLAGSGSMSEGKYKGIAPGAKVIMAKAFNNVGEGSFSDIIAAMGWIIENKEKYKVRILCLPFGADAIVNHRLDPLCTACRAAWDSGIITLAPSGNKGPHTGTITTPGVEPSIITVGCCECRDLNIRNWSIPDFSSRGWKKEDETKPELIAPGVNITSLSTDASFLPMPGKKKGAVKNLENPYCSLTGSSVSTAIAAGCIAMLLEKMPNLSGTDLKGMLKLSCQTINEGKTSQGYGVIDMKKLLDK